ncbi:MAG: sensor histidine kinase [Dorea sp.]|nr:sensor histidine kinase [Dorea sp.]
MKLRTKILLMCLGSTLFALVLQTILFQETSSRLIYNQAKKESENSLQNMQNEIYGFVKNIENNLIEIYTEDSFIKEMGREKDIQKLRAEFYRKAYDIVVSKFESLDSVVSLYLYTPDHKIISTYRRAVTPRHNYQTDIYMDREQENAGTVMDYVESDETVMLISSYFNPYREKDIIRFVLKLYGNSNSRDKIGYIICDVDSKAFVSIMEKYRTDNTMYIWLQPDRDRAVVSLGKTTDEEEDYYAEISEKIASGGEAVISEGSKRELFKIEQNKYNLTAYSLMPQSLLRQNQRNLTVNLILIASLMLLVASVLTVAVSKSMTRPLESLMDTIQKIKEGNRDLRSDLKSKDEIGRLGSSFNEMLDQTEVLRERENQANRLLAQAEYKALQAQINPHFLYNTLDTMSSIAEVKNCREVSLLSQSLSNIFRYSLNMKEHLSTVAKEIIHLKNYSYVMSIRMQDNVKYIYEIDKRTLQDKIPRISLQPIVENALNHGLRNKRGNKEIRISTEIEGELLKICISDNGVGMEAETLNEKLSRNELTYIEEGNSIGLHNINARLKMLYGNAYGLFVESRPGEGTSICMTLPREQKDGNA